MKIAIVADLHLNKNVYRGVPDREWNQLPFRTGDFMRAFRFICNETINATPDVMMINGDIYDHFEPTNEVRGFFSSQLKRLVEANIPIIILIGNHDVCRKHHALKDIQELGIEKIRVVDKPTILDWKDSNFRFLLFPYSLDIERGLVSTQEEFNKFVENIHEKEDDTKTSLFFGHCGIQNAILNQYAEEENTNTITPIQKPVMKAFRNRNSDDVNMADLDSIGAEYVFLGDFHQFQVMDTKSCISMYTGSIEKNNFTEASQGKGFVIYDDTFKSETNMGCCKFIEYPHCRPMAELKGNLDDMRKQFGELNYSDYKDGIFKLSFAGEREDLIYFSTGLDALKKDIIEKTNAIHVFHKQVLENKKMEDQASKVEKEIEDNGHINASDVIDVVKEIIQERVSDEDECSRVTELAIEIYRTSMENN